MNFLCKNEVLRQRRTEEDKVIERFCEDINKKLQDYRDDVEVKIVIPDCIADLRFEDIKTLLMAAGWKVRDNIQPGFGHTLYMK